MNIQQVTGAGKQLRLHQHCQLSLQTNDLPPTVPLSLHVHVQYTTIVTSHKTLLDLLDVRVQLRFTHTHTLLRALGSKCNLSIKNCTTPARPLRAAWWTMVLPEPSVLWSSASIFGAKYSMVLTWPPCAAKCRALRPNYKQNKYKWTDDWYTHAVVVKQWTWTLAQVSIGYLCTSLECT